jgi:type II secretory pathway component PulM
VIKKYFAHLRPMERRLVIGVGVILFLVVNAWLVWPHFSDWNDLSQRQSTARVKLSLYQEAVSRIPKLQAQVGTFESVGEVVALEDQSINMMRSIQSQASSSGVGIQNYSRLTTRTNDAFFVEQVQNISVIATEDQLVNFLYRLGSGASMIRVRDLELQPDAEHYHLTANIRLVASYQKNALPAVARPSVPATPPALPLPPGSANIFAGAKRITNSTSLKQ